LPNIFAKIFIQRSLPFFLSWKRTGVKNCNWIQKPFHKKKLVINSIMTQTKMQSKKIQIFFKPEQKKKKSKTEILSKKWKEVNLGNIVLSCKVKEKWKTLSFFKSVCDSRSLKHIFSLFFSFDSCPSRFNFCFSCTPCPLINYRKNFKLLHDETYIKQTYNKKKKQKPMIIFLGNTYSNIVSNFLFFSSM